MLSFTCAKVYVNRFPYSQYFYIVIIVQFVESIFLHQM